MKVDWKWMVVVLVAAVALIAGAYTLGLKQSAREEVASVPETVQPTMPAAGTLPPAHPPVPAAGTLPPAHPPMPSAGTLPPAHPPMPGANP